MTEDVTEQMRPREFLPTRTHWGRKVKPAGF